MITEVVVATVGCNNAHLTEVLYISPVVNPDGTVDGMLGSSADFCDVCGSSAVVLGARLEERDLKPSKADTCRVTRKEAI